MSLFTCKNFYLTKYQLSYHLQGKPVIWYQYMEHNRVILAIKSPKWPPEKTKMPFFLILSTSIWLKTTYMVRWAWLDENETLFRSCRWKSRVLGVENGEISAEKSPKWPLRKQKCHFFSRYPFLYGLSWLLWPYESSDTKIRYIFLHVDGNIEF